MKPQPCRSWMYLTSSMLLAFASKRASQFSSFNSVAIGSSNMRDCSRRAVDRSLDFRRPEPLPAELDLASRSAGVGHFAGVRADRLLIGKTGGSF
jgi:hypothetical protein